jgi:hypothetical protein
VAIAVSLLPVSVSAISLCADFLSSGSFANIANYVNFHHSKFNLKQIIPDEPESP